MSLVLDKRQALNGKPGVHAFIIGVSAYEHLPGGTGIPMANSYGMKQLTSAALSAYALYDWLITHQVSLPLPLATVRLLLSPSAKEIAKLPVLSLLKTDCSRNNFMTQAYEWREDASKNQNDMTLFYFVGHGLSPNTPNSTAMLMADFGTASAPLLDKSVEVGNLVAGMMPSNTFANIARKQLYFVDCCRLSDDEFYRFPSLMPPQLFDSEFSPKIADDRTVPVFFASIPGTKACAIPLDKTLFCTSLLDCLTAFGADYTEDFSPNENRWCVSIHSLVAALDKHMSTWKSIPGGVDQQFTTQGVSRNALICSLDAPPELEGTLEIDPDDALEFARLEITSPDGISISVPKPLDPHPYKCRWKAGFYTLAANVDPPNPQFKDKPPRVYSIEPRSMCFRWKVSMV